MGTEREKQEFNFAISDLNRVNILCASIEDSMMQMNAFDWFTGLQTLSATLSPYMDDAEIKAVDVMLTKLWVELSKQLSNNSRRGTNEIPQNLFQELKDIYVKLRKIQKDSDLLGRAKTDFFEPENW